MGRRGWRQRGVRAARSACLARAGAGGARDGGGAVRAGWHRGDSAPARRGARHRGGRRASARPRRPARGDGWRGTRACVAGLCGDEDGRCVRGRRDDRQRPRALVSARRGPTVAHRAQYAALRAFAWLLGLLSWRAATNLAGSIGTLFYSPLGIRRRVAEKQIAAAFPERSSREVSRVARESYRHLGLVAAETALFSRLDGPGILSHMEGIEGLELFVKQRAQGRGAIVLTGHVGNWEIGGAAIAASGIPIDVVVRLMGNPLFDDYLTGTRNRLGMTVVRDRDAVRHTARALRDRHVMAFLIDQSGLHIASSFVPFFGRPAKTPRGPAVLALRLNVPVFFGVSIRRPDGRYHMTISEIATERTTDTDVDAILKEYSRLLEHFVRLAPEQYFWQHRRWKRQPAGTPPELRDPV